MPRPRIYKDAAARQRAYRKRRRERREQVLREAGVIPEGYRLNQSGWGKVGNMVKKARRQL